MIIAIVGLISSGKGTVGDILSDHYGFKKESFAKPLKDAASNIFGWDRRMLEGDTENSRKFRETVDEYWSKVLDKPNFTPRYALQLLGTQAGRDVFGEKLWTSSCIARCAPKTEFTYDSRIQNFVITDCRFKNEIEAVRESNGIIVHVCRGEYPNHITKAYEIFDQVCSLHGYDAACDALKHMSELQNIHQSEWDWVGSDFDFVIENNGTLADLDAKVYDILFKLKINQLPYKQSYVTKSVN
jgi:hypothetical protein